MFVVTGKLNRFETKRMSRNKNLSRKFEIACQNIFYSV